MSHPVFAVPMRTRFRGIDVREGMLLRGDAGWGEFSPFLEYDAPRRRALAARRPGGRRRGLAGAAARPGPGQRHRAGRRPRAGPRDRARRRLPTAKVKVAEPGQSTGRRRGPGRGGARRPRPRRARPGRRQRRLERRRGRHRDRRCSTAPPAAWSTSSSRARASRTWPGSAGASTYPIAADESIRRAEDPYRVRDLEAADVAVLKVQPLGGVRACLRIAEDIGLPVVVSSALETSVGIAAGVALAAALPDAGARLRAGDGAAADRRRGRSTRCCRWTASCPSSDPEVDPVRLAAVAATPGRGSRTGRRGWPRSGRIDAREPRPRDRDRRRRSDARSGPHAASTSWSAAASPTWCSARAHARPPLAFAAHAAAAAATSRCTPASTSAPPASSPSGWPAPRAARSSSSRRAAPRPPTCTRPCSRPSHAGLPLVVLTADRPARLRGTGANQTTDQVHLYGTAARLFADVPAGAPGHAEAEQVAGWRSLAARALLTAEGAPVRRAARCTSTCSSTGPRRRTPPTAGAPTWAAASTACRGPGARACPPRWCLARRQRRTTTTSPTPGTTAHPRSWSPGTTPARRRACWPRSAAGRCSPSPPAAPAPAPTRSAPTGCCSATPTSPGGSERVVVAGHPTLSRPVTRLLSRDDVEVVALRDRLGGWTDPGHRVDRVLDQAPLRPAHARGAAATAGPWLQEWLDRDADARRPPRRPARRDRRPHPPARRRRGRVRAARPAGCSSSAPPTRSATST